MQKTTFSLRPFFVLITHYTLYHEARQQDSRDYKHDLILQEEIFVQIAQPHSLTSVRPDHIPRIKTLLSSPVKAVF